VKVLLLTEINQNNIHELCDEFNLIIVGAEGGDDGMIMTKVKISTVNLERNDGPKELAGLRARAVERRENEEDKDSNKEREINLIECYR